jgi:ankyrin repeat protein
MAVDKDGRTPLHAAVQGGLGYVKFLVDSGADVKAADKDGRTPLHDAARAGSVGLTKVRTLRQQTKTDARLFMP